MLQIENVRRSRCVECDDTLFEDEDGDHDGRRHAGMEGRSGWGNDGDFLQENVLGIAEGRFSQEATHVALAMRFSEEQRGALPDVVEGVDDLAALLVFLVVSVVGDGVALVRVGMEQIAGFDGGGSALLVAEDEVDPVVEARRDVLALEGLAEFRDEEERAALRPLGKHDGAHLVSVLFRAEGNAVGVDEEVGGAVEFRDELLDVLVARRDALPRDLDGVEHAVGVVEATALENDVAGGEGLVADEVEEHDGDSAVVREVVEGNVAKVFEILEANDELGFTFLAISLKADGVLEAAECGRRFQIEFRTRVVRDNPGEDWILGEVKNRALGEVVEAEKILEVGELALRPLIAETFLVRFAIRGRDDFALVPNLLSQISCLLEDVDEVVVVSEGFEANENLGEILELKHHGGVSHSESSRCGEDLDAGQRKDDLLRRRRQELLRVVRDGRIVGMIFLVEIDDDLVGGHCDDGASTLHQEWNFADPGVDKSFFEHLLICTVTVMMRSTCSSCCGGCKVVVPSGGTCNC